MGEYHIVVTTQSQIQPERVIDAIATRLLDDDIESFTITIFKFRRDDGEIEIEPVASLQWLNGEKQ